MKPLIDEDTIFCCDKSDIVKPASKKLEALSKVRDGSTGKMKDGYDTFEIAALTKTYQMPVSLYSRIYSSLEKGFKSQNIETIKGLDYMKEHLDLLLTILIGFIAMNSEKRKSTKLGLWIRKLAKRVFKIPTFDFYAKADGMKNI